MPELEIQLFGDLQVSYRGRSLSALHAPRQQALLAWLLLHAGTPQSRKRIAFTFWPDSREDQALTNLRRELHHLRQVLPDAERFVAVTAQTVYWRDERACYLDTAAFEQALATARAGSDLWQRRLCLERAVDLYRGDLLAGLYEDWLEPFRESLHQQAVEALDALVGSAGEGESERTLGYAQRLLALEPLRERAYAHLMRLHLERGDRAAALRTFHRCVQVLDEELGTVPGSVVQEVYRRLQDGDATPPPGAPPLVGRVSEWARVLAAWHEATRSGTRVVVITGEAGIGKSRLADALARQAEVEGASVARTRSYAAEGRLAYGPLGDWLRSPALRARTAIVGKPWLAELARLMPDLLLQYPDLPAPEPLREGWQRQRFFEALVKAFLAGDGPLLLLLDDVQWCDRDTLEWLHYLLRSTPKAPLLLLCTLRSEEQADNPALGQFLVNLQQRGLLDLVELGPLSCEESADLAASVLGGDLEPALQARLFAATEGQPLFIIEMARSGLTLEDNASALALTPKVQAVITARLEQLSEEARGVAQLAATIGRAFDYEVLREASDLDEVALVAALDELWQRAIIRFQPQSSDGLFTRYDFSHDRLREGAYHGLSPLRRRLLHRRVAQALEISHAPELDRVAAQLAAQHEQGGQIDKAVAIYLRAAERANDISASQEAIRLAERAMRLLEHLPDEQTRDRQELELRKSMVAALSALKGFTPPELEMTLNRALELAEKLGDGETVIRSFWGLYALHIVRGNIRLARSFADKALLLAGDDSDLLTDCHHALGGVDLIEAKLAEAGAHFATAKRLYPLNRHRRTLFGADVGVFSLAWGAHGLWLQGHVELARADLEQAAALAAELEHPFIEAQALAYRSISHQLERDVEAAWTCAEAVVVSCERYNVAYYREWGVIIGGWVLAQRGRAAEGAARIERGIEALHHQDALLRRPYYLALLAECHLLTGRPEAARAALDVAESLARQNRDLWYLPELYRLRGLSDTARAESHVRRALAVAREQESRALELRAATSLAAHLRNDGRSEEAAALLEPVLAVFPDHLETPDLREARDLLATLS